jgi:hypothetical protein
MPCQHCKSTGHTLIHCREDIEPFWGPIRRSIECRPFALRNQYQQLSRLPCSVLKLINHKFGYISSGNKLVLINQIVNHYFLAIIPNDRINPLVQRPDIQVKAGVLEGFMALHMWSTRNEAERSFRESGLVWLDMYHRNAFNESYAQALRNNINYPIDIIRQASQELRDAAFARILELGIVREMIQRPLQQQPPQQPPQHQQPRPRPQSKKEKSHLKKLKIKLKVDKQLESKECFMCYDTKTHIKLGCDHEYCSDCLVGTAKVRTKTFITCAVCRSEVGEVRVKNAEIKKSLAQELKKE